LPSQRIKNDASFDNLKRLFLQAKVQPLNKKDTVSESK